MAGTSRLFDYFHSEFHSDLNYYIFVAARPSLVTYSRVLSFNELVISYCSCGDSPDCQVSEINLGFSSYRDLIWNVIFLYYLISAEHVLRSQFETTRRTGTKRVGATANTAWLSHMVREMTADPPTEEIPRSSRTRRPMLFVRKLDTDIRSRTRASRFWKSS
ncbi:hypothetical protein BO94DRAFT_59320 [Aspergillus sclerotioniger CBS 115572]|uniref:Uncharacterized protein n=1 Tax=Aspergillus sclerotioniger CBS 115572 TaxID=1450535 RepID=A0A317WS45_9EURO|nr:hypothetical protein BO94DRAFT_59320 [Aspergillus sclerotioniger CBS 115572]PWY87947.1 hypothetical protein BO94DRAFT_59320 [Aspergillus sclerotioniger CBS 115572]